MWKHECHAGCRTGFCSSSGRAVSMPYASVLQCGWHPGLEVPMVPVPVMDVLSMTSVVAGQILADERSSKLMPAAVNSKLLA